MGFDLRRPWRRLATFESRILLLALAVGLPGTVSALLLVWLGELPWVGEFQPRLQWSLTIVLLLLWGRLATILRYRVTRPLQTIANLLSAVREGDFSLRVRDSEEPDALSQVVHEVNALGDTLREQRLGAVEAEALLDRLVAEVDVAVFAFDDADHLQLVNRAGERLLAAGAERLLGKTAAELELADCLHFEGLRIVSRAFPSGQGRWEIRLNTYREGGLPNHLLMVTDLSLALREEERQAWQRLIRVLGHELNNSLAPIHSMSATLGSLLGKRPRPDDWEEDMVKGLELIGNRAEALIRFLAAYSRLARLPPPRKQPVALGPLIRRIAELETRLPVFVEKGPEVTVSGDADQLEQLLINLIRNAVDAALSTNGLAGVGWQLTDGSVEVRVEDEGPGLASTENLFVPFYTTKPGGTGIGLALSRQIAEAHGGHLELRNRAGAPGCVAELRLPLETAPPTER
jgi:nitrogen fixation/metabolism regulation signal transduction histidine kinase